METKEETEVDLEVIAVETVAISTEEVLVVEATEVTVEATKVETAVVSTNSKSLVGPLRLGATLILILAHGSKVPNVLLRINNGVTCGTREAKTALAETLGVDLKISGWVLVVQEATKASILAVDRAVTMVTMGVTKTIKATLVARIGADSDRMEVQKMIITVLIPNIVFELQQLRNMYNKYTLRLFQRYHTVTILP